MFVMISGPPGSGKSTLSRPIADELRVPLIAKDAIKEALMDVLGYPASIEESRVLGRAAVMAMLNVAASSRRGAVLDSTFFPYAFARLRSRQPDELWNDENTRPTGIAPAIVVDTTHPVDVAAVVRQIQELARPASTI